MIDSSVRPTSYTLHFLIRCLAKGQDYNGLERLFQIWNHFNLVSHTRMEYWHLKNLINILIDNKRQDLILHFLSLTHDLKLLEYTEHHSDRMRHRDGDIQSEIIRKMCLYGTQSKEQINDWIRFVTTH